MFIIKYRKVFFAIGVLLLGVSLFAIITKGFTYGVDFTGGSVLQVRYTTLRPEITTLQGEVHALFPQAEVVAVGEQDVRVRTETIDQETKTQLVTLLSKDQTATETSFNTIGPSVGQELRAKAKWSIGIVSLAIILFIAFAFRKVSKPISSWAYGIIAIVVLVHDVVLPAGYFAFSGTTVDTLFVVGLLTILGVSINDTIVVFDRIRENLHTNHSKNFKEDFAITVGKSINQTFVRSIMTSLTVLIALAALYLYGPVATHNLAITMFLGMFFGTYSSIFLASPLLVEWNNWKNKKA
jgi:preprotein translocase subunit SecF